MAILDLQQINNSSHILFLTHLAIGDFVYYAPYFRKLSKEFPNLKIDVCIDESRIKKFMWPGRATKKASVYDWAITCPFFNKVYRISYSKKVLNSVVKDMKAQEYPIVVFLGVLRMARYNLLARKISEQGFAVGIKSDKNKVDKKLDMCLGANIDDLQITNPHISDLYGSWFEKLFGFVLSKEEKYPFIDIPQEWKIKAKKVIENWGIPLNTSSNKIMFINAFSSSKKRSWPILNVVDLIKILRTKERFSNFNFIINIPPDTLEEDLIFINNNLPPKSFVFTANENFFQLPAMISLCDFVISTETSTMHLSQALNIPSLVLKRSKEPEWCPYGMDVENVIFAKNGNWISDISVEAVQKKIIEFL
jgi:heptosyltransferase III